MKYLTLILLTLSLNVFAFGSTTHNHGGAGGDGGNASNTNLVVTTSSTTSGAYSTSGVNNSGNSLSASGVNNSGNSASISGGGDAEVGDITNKAKVKNSGNADQEQANNNDIRYSSVYEATESVASSAPSISTAGCQVGSSGQIKDGGFSAITDSPLCMLTIAIDIERIGLANSTYGSDEWYEHEAEIDKLEVLLREYVADMHELAKTSQKAAHVGQIVFWLTLIRAGLFGL